MSNPIMWNKSDSLSDLGLKKSKYGNSKEYRVKSILFLMYGGTEKEGGGHEAG